MTNQIDGTFEMLNGRWVVRCYRYVREGDAISVARKGGAVERIVKKVIAVDGKGRVGGGGKSYVVEVR
jgi:hypothetical protein